MRIGIIGSGNIGGTAARLFARAGHEVAVSNTRGPASLAGLVASLGSRAKAASPADAVAFGDAVLLALPWRNVDRLPPGDLFAGTIVIDATNPFGAGGRVMDLGESTSTEEVAKRIPRARVVKAFNTMGWKTLETGSQPPTDDRLAIFVAGDDGGAKEIVSDLIEGIGFSPVDTGSLREGGRRQQPGSPLFGRPLTVREAADILGSKR